MKKKTVMSHPALFQLDYKSVPLQGWCVDHGMHVPRQCTKGVITENISYTTVGRTNDLIIKKYIKIFKKTKKTKNVLLAHHDAVVVVVFEI